MDRYIVVQMQRTTDSGGTDTTFFVVDTNYSPPRIIADCGNTLASDTHSQDIADALNASVA